LASGLLLGTGALLLAAVPGQAGQPFAAISAEDDGGGGGDSGGGGGDGGGTSEDSAPAPEAPASDEAPTAEDSASDDPAAVDSGASTEEPGTDEGSSADSDQAGDTAGDQEDRRPDQTTDGDKVPESDNPTDEVVGDDTESTEDGVGEDYAGEEDYAGDEDYGDDEAVDEEFVEDGAATEEFTGDVSELPFVPDAQTTVTANLVVQVAPSTDGASVSAAGAGLAAEVRYEIWVFSTPQLVATGFTDAAGAFAASAELPDTLAPGPHTVLVRSTSGAGLPTEAGSAITIGALGELLAVEPNADTSQLSAPALPASPKAPPYAPVVALDEPEAVVTTAVAALSLVAVAGAGIGAAAAAGMRIPDRIDRIDGQLRGEREQAGLEVAVQATQDALDDIDVEHNRGWRTKFVAKGSAWGDKSGLHRAPGTAVIDEISYTGIAAVAPRSPLLARALADGGPVRAMLGSLSLLLPVAGVALAITAAILGEGIAQPPMLALMIPLMLLGIIDGLAGMMSSVAFALTVAVMGGIVDWSSVRTLLGIALLIAGPGLIAGTFRDIRRPVGGGMTQRWERLTDLVVVPLVGAWTTLNIVEALPALGGAAFPIAQSGWILATVVLFGLLAKVGLEFAAAKWFPERLATVLPKATPQVGTTQQVTSALLRTGIFLFVSAAFVGNVWQLWVAALLFLIPNLLALVADRFPNSVKLWSISPGSVLKLGLILLLSWGITVLALNRFGDTAQFAQMAFLLLAIPGFLLSLVALFGRHPAPGQQSWHYRPAATWVYRGGGVAVLAFTVWLALTV
jgi:hypothetical protein